LNGKGGDTMFVNIIKFPAVKKGKEDEFKKWFEWSNTVYEKFDGFISRRLLKSTKGKKKYVGIVEHETEKTFMAMHLSDERQRAWAKVEPLLTSTPTPTFYEVVIACEK
jgi:heme-degrading monooxygenase HmoA